MRQHEITAARLPLSGLQKVQGHKFTHGHAVVVSGGSGRTGAARLAARGALRVGAGLVTLAVPAPALVECAAQVTAIMLYRLDTPQTLTELLRDDRINALCVGPALGLSAQARETVEIVLTLRLPLVLDADALTLLAQDRALMSLLHGGCVMTPHAGEFARLFPDISERLTANRTGSKPEAAAAAARRAGCIVLLKGAQTVVARPSGVVAVQEAENARAAPWLATAGSGDVLAGLVTGLMARGFAPGQAAELAVFLHLEAALSFGPGLIAEDIPDEVPRVLHRIFDGRDA